MAHLSYFAAVLLVSSLAACGGKSFDTDPDPNQGGSEQGGSGNGGTRPNAGSTHGGTTSKGGTPTGGTGQGGAVSVCDSFNDELGSFINVAIYNQTMLPISLGQDMLTCGVEPYFAVQDATGVALPPPGGCRQSCQALRSSGPGGCAAICLFPTSVTLQPGEVMYTSWDGLFQVQTELPSKCAPAGNIGSSCDQAKTIQPGNFTFSARAGTSLDCSQTTGGMCSACAPTGNGGCTTPGSLIGGKVLSATTTVLLDASFGVYGSAPPPPAPAPAYPGDPSGDAPGGLQAFRTVELIFTQ